MFFRMVLFVWEFVLDLVAVIRMGENEKDLQILLLRQQLRIVERKQERGPQIPRWQKRRRQRDSIDGAHTATFFTAKHVADKLLENLSQAS